MRAASLAICAAALAACGGIRVEGVRYFDPPVVVNVPEPSVYALQASGAAMVHSRARWRDVALGDRPWLISGADDTHAHWFSYLSFPLDVLPARTHVESALVTMPVHPSSEPTPPGQRVFYDVHLVFGTWEPSSVTWMSQPLVGATPIARFEVFPSSDVDTIDLSWVVNELASKGATRLDLLVVPASPELPFRRMWRTVELDSPHVAWSEGAPHLTVRVGDPPPAPSQAELDALALPPTP